MIHWLCNRANETWGTWIHVQAFINRHGQKHRQVEQMVNRYIEGKAEEYSSKRAWSSIGEQYPSAWQEG